MHRENMWHRQWKPELKAGDDLVSDTELLKVDWGRKHLIPERGWFSVFQQFSLLFI